MKEKIKVVIGVAELRSVHNSGLEPLVLIGRVAEGKPYAGFWSLPGGKVERGESPEDAMFREWHEETGVKLPPPSVIPLKRSQLQPKLEATLCIQKVQYDFIFYTIVPTLEEKAPTEAFTEFKWVRRYEALENYDLTPAAMYILAYLRATDRVITVIA